MDRARIGVIGVGNMGLGVALRLRELGHELIVRDIDPQRQALAEGCTIAADAAAVARAAALVIVVVVDAAQTEDVLFGRHGVAAAGSGADAVMLCPTIAPGDVEHFTRRLDERGIGTLDAPMSGGPDRARQGTMSLMLACRDRLFERWESVLRGMSDRLFRISERPGDGARTKLVNNLLAAINLAGTAEAFAMAQRLGLDPAATLDVIEQSSGQSWIGSERMRRALAGDLRPRAQMSLLAKDSRLAVAEAAATALELPTGAAAAAQFAAACAAGWNDRDDAALWRFVAAQSQPLIPSRVQTHRRDPPEPGR